MPFDFSMIGVTIALFCVAILSFLVWRIYAQLGAIFKDSKEQSTIGILNKLVTEQELAKSGIASLLARTNTLEEHEKLHIQKVGLTRFNPFQDTGGDQSFILALLDKKNTGIIISGLYARSGMRWYVKRVIEGKGQDHDLSKEEKKAIDSAI